jgi:protein required for attachment to host cells
MARETWVLVADSCLARLFRMGEEPRDWELINEFHHRDSRLSGRELDGTGSGDIQNNGATYRNALEPLSLKRLEAEKFARTLSAMLHDAMVGNAFEDLVLVAAPEFLGLLRKSLSPSVTRRVTGTLNKDYAHLAPREIVQQLVR